MTGHKSNSATHKHLDLARLASRAAGMPPGTLVSDPTAEATRLRVVGCRADRCETIDDASFDDAKRIRSEYELVWWDVSGLRDVEKIADLAQLAGMHPLALEDAIKPYQRPKIQAFGDNLFLVVRMAPQLEETETEQLAVSVTEGLVVTFQERRGDCFDSIRARLDNAATRPQYLSVDRLLHALVDVLIDAYFPLLENIGETVENLEQAVLAGTDPKVLSKLYITKRQLLAVRRAMWPTRDLLSHALTNEYPHVRREASLLLRDLYDHVVHIIDLVELYREMTASLADVHLSKQSNRLNEVMMVLTTIATIFIPLTFITSVYGMNFDPEASPYNMPELKTRYGYVVLWVFMIGITAVQFWIFYRRGWILRSWRFLRSKAEDL